MRLIQQLDEDNKQTIFKLIDKMLTNKKFKDFFNKRLLVCNLRSFYRLKNTTFYISSL